MTQHHHTPPPDPMPLDPEERALAARLARLGPHGEPSPALDARVLAAAHAAATAHHARSARERGWRRARWPVGVGVAASVVLAAGIAWQMRPLPAPQFPAGASARADAAMTAAPGSTHAAAAPENARMPASPRTMPPPPPQEVAAAAVPVDDVAATASTEATTARQATASDVAAAKSPATPPPSPPEPPVVFDAPAPVDVAAPPPGPPAPPAPTAQARQGAATRAANDAAQAQVVQPVFDASEADAPEGDVPPATAASPQVRDAWLARIRELAATGRADEARASLAEFHRRYPAFAIPADLRPLLPAATPAPEATPTTKPPPR